MKTLPSSFAVLNDGSEAFQIVVDYLNEDKELKYFRKKIDETWEDYYYGIDKTESVNISVFEEDFDTILTIEEFKNAIK